nr:hypothetical protein CFP56_11309 [Quercus suber]
MDGAIDVAHVIAITLRDSPPHFQSLNTATVIHSQPLSDLSGGRFGISFLHRPRSMSIESYVEHLRELDVFMSAQEVSFHRMNVYDDADS